jgi:hypothetical protein
MKNLAQAFDHGYELTGIHGYYKFEQDYIFKDYIGGNNIKKQNATINGNKFLRQLAKDMNNIIFGKTIQNVTNQRDVLVRLFKGWSQENDINRIKNVKAFHQITENLMIIEKEKTNIKLNMPIFIGKAVLDLSKEHMYNFLHNVFMPKYQQGKLLYMDTDSFVLEIPDNEKGFNDFVEANRKWFDIDGLDNEKYDTLYKEIQDYKFDIELDMISEELKDKHIQKCKAELNADVLKLHDLREKAKENYNNMLFNNNVKYFDDIDEYERLKQEELTKRYEAEWKKDLKIRLDIKINAGYPGLFKSETDWHSIVEFVALRPKQYSYYTENGKKEKAHMKCKGISLKKGIKLNTEKDRLTHQDMVDQIFKEGCKPLHMKQDHFVSKRQNVSTEFVSKEALINYEDKCWLVDPVYSLAYGHPWIKDYMNGMMSRTDIKNRIKGNDNYVYPLSSEFFDEQELKPKKEILHNNGMDVPDNLLQIMELDELERMVNDKHGKELLLNNGSIHDDSCINFSDTKSVVLNDDDIF